ncbi:response regulator [Paenibacillaceae bacterium]|nr:response regulator [Paenibacillaceae bacterium]
MFQMLIVDDEIHAVRTIESCVDWAELSITRIHIAYNIRQAKKIFEEHPIDLMICDIEMPQGSGIELLTWVRERHSSTESIFLTCHSDFDYAKRAIQLGSLDYLLKPVQFNELKSIVQKGLEKVAEQREAMISKESNNYYSKLWTEHQPVLMERFWEDLLNQRIPANPERIREVLASKNLSVNENDSFVPILIGVHRWFEKFSQRDEKIMEYALLNAAEYMILNRYAHGQIVRMGSDILLAILPVGERDSIGREEMSELCERYMNSCNRYFRCDLTCYVGKRGSMCEMVKQFDDLLEMRRNNINQNNKVLFLHEYGKTAGNIDLIQMNVWLEMMKRGAYDAILLETEQYLSSWTVIEGLQAEVLQHFFQNFLQILYHFIQFKEMQAYQVLGELIAMEQMALAVRSVNNLQLWVRKALEQTIKCCCAVDDTQTVMDKIKQFVKQHLDQAISRDDIARHVNLHPDYLSRLFKKETGKSLVEYIVEEKMAIAKELLLTTDRSVSDIAMCVGYSNFSYFSKIFKHEMQMNPNQFRKSFRSAPDQRKPQ